LLSRLFALIVCSHIRDSHLYILPDPDKWRSDCSHGLSNEEAEEKFKMIQNAADHLLSRFDEESSHHSGSSHADSDDNVQYSNVQQYFYEEYCSDDDGEDSGG
jgi:hypothetical protein